MRSLSAACSAARDVVQTTWQKLLQYVVVWYSVLPCVAMGCNVSDVIQMHSWYGWRKTCCSVLQCAAVYCSVLPLVAVCCNVLQCVAVCCRVLQCVVACKMHSRYYRLKICCSALQCVAVCCRVLQCVVECCSVLQCVTVCKPNSRFLWVCSFYVHCRWCRKISQDCKKDTVFAKSSRIQIGSFKWQAQANPKRWRKGENMEKGKKTCRKQGLLFFMSNSRSGLQKTWRISTHMMWLSACSCGQQHHMRGNPAHADSHIMRTSLVSRARDWA